VERQGQAALHPDTRRLAADYIGNWQGAAKELRNGTLESAIQSLGPEQRSAARLVLLTALAPHHVDEKVVREFADPRKEQVRILGAISWASFTAARRIGARLAPACVCA
jgi:hypothetical protein